MLEEEEPLEELHEPELGYRCMGTEDAVKDTQIGCVGTVCGSPLHQLH